jgi:hypothetical protein
MIRRVTKKFIDLIFSPNNLTCVCDEKRRQKIRKEFNIIKFMRIQKLGGSEGIWQHCVNIDCYREKQMK